LSVSRPDQPIEAHGYVSARSGPCHVASLLARRVLGQNRTLAGPGFEAGRLYSSRNWDGEWDRVVPAAWRTFRLPTMRAWPRPRRPAPTGKVRIAVRRRPPQTTASSRARARTAA